MTHTFAVLEVSQAVFDEVHAKLTAAGYDHAFIGDTIDMHGIGIKAVEPDPAGPKLVTPEGRELYPIDREAVMSAMASLSDEAFGQFCIVTMVTEIKGFFGTYADISEPSKESIRRLGAACSRFIRGVR